VSITRGHFLALNALGGAAILASYAHGILTQPDPGAAWGGVPDGLRPLYVASMLAAAAGYFPMTGYVLSRFQRSPGLFSALYAAILLPSALWMPLTFAYLESPSAPLWWAVRGVLLLVGAGSLGVLAVLAAQREGRGAGWAAALAGACAFSLQTALLDALVWPAYFPV